MSTIFWFTDLCQATLDGPDGLSKGWVFLDNPAHIRLRRQLGEGGVIFWAGIVGNKMIGRLKCQEVWRLPSHTVTLLGTSYLTLLNELSFSELKAIFLHDNAPAYSPRWDKTYSILWWSGQSFSGFVSYREHMEHYKKRKSTEMTISTRLRKHSARQCKTARAARSKHWLLPLTTASLRSSNKMVHTPNTNHMFMGSVNIFFVYFVVTWFIYVIRVTYK